MVCVLCEINSTETWFGSFCSDCRKIKNLGNVYGFERTLSILTKCCIRDEDQLERKIISHKKLPTIPEESETDLSYERPKTRKSK